MATFLGKGYFDGYNGSHFYLELWYELISQSTKNNTSTFRLLSYVGSQDGYEGHGAMAYIYPHCSIAGIIDSSVACGYYDNIPVNTKVGPGYSQNYTVKHADNGKLSLYVYTTTSNSWSGVGYASAGGTINFPDIARYPMIVQAPNFNDEENPTITYTTTLGFPDSTIEAGIFNSNGTTAYASYRTITLEDTSYTFNLTETERTALRTATQGGNTLNVKFIIRTTTADSQTFTSESAKVMTLINCSPTFTYTSTETNTKVTALLGSSASTVIQNASIVRFAVTPTLRKNAASVASVKVEHDGSTYQDTTSPYQIDVPVTANSFTITTIDSRGNGTGEPFTKTLIEYQPVDITSLTMKRANSTSPNIILNLEAKYFQKTFGSTANVPTVKWKLDDGSYTTIPSSAYTIDTANNKLTITNYTISNALVYTSNGTFTIEISDLLTSDTDSRQVLKGVATYDVGEHDLQVNGDLFIADTNRNNPVNVKDMHKVDITTDGSAVKTGRIIDGYDEYVKRFSFSGINSAGEYSANLGFTLSDVLITRIDGVAYSNSSNYFPITIGDFNGTSNFANSVWLRDTDSKLVLTTATPNFSNAYIDISYIITS